MINSGANGADGQAAIGELLFDVISNLRSIKRRTSRMDEFELADDIWKDADSASGKVESAIDLLEKLNTAGHYAAAAPRSAPSASPPSFELGLKQ